MAKVIKMVHQKKVDNGNTAKAVEFLLGKN